MKKVITIILVFALVLLTGCGESKPATVLYVENDAYNLTPQEYIDLMNSSIEQQDANYPTIPNWDVNSESMEIGMWVDRSDIYADNDGDITKCSNVGTWFNELRIETNADEKIIGICYEWEIKDQELTDAAYFMAGLTIGMAVGPENIQTVYDALDMAKTGVSSYINECDNNGSHFYFTSYGYGKYNYLHISPVEPNAEEVPSESETES